MMYQASNDKQPKQKDRFHCHPPMVGLAKAHPNESAHVVIVHNW